MRRFVLPLTVMMVAFVLGVGANALVDRGLGPIVERWTDDPKSFLGQLSITLLGEEPKFNPGVNYCGLLVVSITNDRQLYLNRQEMGSLDNKHELAATLREIFRRRTELHAYRDDLDLNPSITENERIEKTVFIKAPRGMSYGEVSDLIEVIKEAGAGPIGLVTDSTGFSKPRPLLR
jgi:biopolymer transport protein ExbD